MLNIERILKEMEKRKAKRVFLQVPEGLKTRVQEFSAQLEKAGLEVLISCEPCFGACDIRDHEAKATGCDVLLHIGHTDFGVKPEVPVIYEPYEIEFDVRSVLAKHLGKLEAYRKICLVSTSQFMSTIPKAKEILEKSGHEILLVGQTRSGKIGQVLGCDYSAALPVERDADCFLYLGSGLFHPLGLALKTGKRVFSLDFDTGELKDMTREKNRFERVRAYNIETARESTNFGILLTTKPGQMLLRQAEHIKKTLESRGKKCWILVMDQITPEKIMGMKFDVLVNCACPRMNEDYRLFRKPILNPEDINKITSHS